MRFVVVGLIALLLAACTEASASRIDERTFRIEGPPCATCGDAPDRRLANRLCPQGYYVLESHTQKGGPDRAIDQPEPMTIWRIRCI